MLEPAGVAADRVDGGRHPLALSETDFAWSFSMIGGVRSSATLHLEDLASPVEGQGLIQLTITGRVEQPAFSRFHLDHVHFEIYGGNTPIASDHVPVRTNSLATDFARGSGTGRTFSPGLTGPDDPITYTLIDFHPGPGSTIEWRAIAELSVYNVGEEPIDLLFVEAFQGLAPTSCKRSPRCGDRLRQVDIFDVIATPIHDTTGLGSARLLVAMVPEPSTGLLVLAGLLGFAGWRREAT